MNKPDFYFEMDLWNKGAGIVAGCDEVGRGCFAGPVVGGAVVFSKNFSPGLGNLEVRIDDSKKLTARQRLISNKWIRKNALAYGIGVASVEIINKVGIVKATQAAIKKAIANMGIEIDHLLSDAFYIPRLRGIPHSNQTPIIKGDSISFSIACASIIAKVHRDNLMNEIGTEKNYKVYEWYKNKGYGTKVHREAISQFGVTLHHRKSFVKTFLSKSSQIKPYSQL